jgi:N-acetylmuramoyl-L-alanine amidase
MATIKKGSKGQAVKELQKLLSIYPDGIFGTLTEERVKEFQAENNLTVDGIVGPVTMAKLLLKASKLKKSKRTINDIIVHCSATPEGKDYTVDDIRAWHKYNGYSDIGYHYVVYRDGSVHEGRNVDIAGAHCKNHNSYSIGVCYIGGCGKDGKTAKDTRTKEQKESLLSLLKELKSLYPKATIHGHRDYANKACPSFDATKEYKDI